MGKGCSFGGCCRSMKDYAISCAMKKAGLEEE
jgi:hypothetical protein